MQGSRLGRPEQPCPDPDLTPTAPNQLTSHTPKRVCAVHQATLAQNQTRTTRLPPLIKVLQDEIMPALDKLRKEKQQYNEWQGARDSVDKLQRFCVAYRYVEAQG